MAEYKFTESKMELDMTIDDIRNEPVDSNRIPRCKRCKRMCYAHDGPTGIDKCKLDILEDEKAMVEDDEKVNRIREKERLEKFKRKKPSETDENSSQLKKIRTDIPSPKEDVEKDSRERMNEVEKLEATLKRKEDETRRLKEDLERKIRKEEEIQSKYHRGAKQKTYNRKTRSRSQTVRESCRERSRRSKSNSRDYRNDRYEGGRHRNEGRRYGDYADRDEERYFRSNDNHYNYNRKLSDPPIWGQHDTFSGWKRRVLLWDEEKEKPERKANMLMESLSKNEHHKEVIELVRQAVIENEAFNWKSYSVVETRMATAI